MKKETTIQVRPAKREDLEAMIEIEAVCFPAAEAAGKKEFHERFRTFGENFFVAEKDGQVIGFINGSTADEAILRDEMYHDTSLHRKDGRYQMVFGLDVLPEYRRQGVASALIRAMIDSARARGRKGVVLTCKDRLIHYYETFGFQWMGVSASSHGGAKWNDMLLTFEGEIGHADA